jgi:hypothetical protein
MPDKFLHIYMNDHLAGATAGRELAKRCLSNNAGTPLGDYLERFIQEITEDRATLEAALESTGGKRDRIKPAAGWLAEKVGRLKLNGQIRGYSPLSRVVELEGLCAGVEAKKAMWIAFEALDDPRLGGFDFAALSRRATGQRESLEAFRVQAAQKAFS